MAFVKIQYYSMTKISFEKLEASLTSGSILASTERLPDLDGRPRQKLLRRWPVRRRAAFAAPHERGRASAPGASAAEICGGNERFAECRQMLMILMSVCIRFLQIFRDFDYIDAKSGSQDRYVEFLRNSEKSAEIPQKMCLIFW